MTSQRELLQMPNVGMLLIMEQCDLESIVRLHKTCHKLRDFINSFQPNIPTPKISITLLKHFINLTISDDQTITYMDYPEQLKRKGCEIIAKDFSTNPKFLDGADYVETFFRDFEFILKLQKKNNLDELSLHLEEHDNIGFVDRISGLLQDKSPILSTKKLHLEVKNRSEIIKIMKFIYPKTIENISIDCLERGDLPEEVVESDQWKNARELSIRDFSLKMLENCLNFSTLLVRCDDIVDEELVQWKEKFIQSPSLEAMLVEVPYRENRNLEKVLGPCDFDNHGNKRWFYKKPNSDVVLCLVDKFFGVELFFGVEQDGKPKYLV